MRPDTIQPTFELQGRRVELDHLIDSQMNDPHHPIVSKDV